MPRPKLRTRSVKKVKKRLPGGAFITHYITKRKGKAKCSRCKSILPGKKRISRTHGGNLCSTCARIMIKNKVVKQ